MKDFFMDILIADDDLMLAELRERGFKRAGFNVHLVHDGIAATTYLQENPLPDTVLVDQMMPGKLGTDVIEELSKIDTEKSVRTILITAAPESVTSEAREMVDILLQKPVSYKELVMFAKRLMGR